MIESSLKEIAVIGHTPPRTSLALFLLLGLFATHADAQTSDFALRFFGTGVGPPGQQDRVLFAVDDNGPGPDASTPIDVGAGDFTIEWWMRGELADNDTANAGGDVQLWDYSWIDGNIILDRDVWCGTERAYGVSIAGGFVRFGTGGGDAVNPDSANTIEGNVNVLDGQWHHVAVVRDRGTGQKHIIVDGAVDFSSSLDASFSDISYPNEGVPVTPAQCGPGQLTPYGWYLVLAAEKHDAGANFPSFNGFVDELRIWSSARTVEEIALNRFLVVAPDAPDLAAAYRFEEGAGTSITDSSLANAPTGNLTAGTLGNGQWVSRAHDPNNTAPLASGNEIFSDGFESGTTGAWSGSEP